MTADELRAAWYEAEVRAKYDEAAMKKMAKSGEAMPNASGQPSYPIADEEDLHNAIHAIGRGHASHEAIRQHIIARAKALGLTHMLPASWTGDGDGDEHNSADEASEERATAAASDDDADDEGGEPDNDEDDENPDSEAGAGKGTEAQGRSDEETAEKHVIANGEEELAKLGLQRRQMEMRAKLQGKRFDPYLDEDGD